MRAVTVEHAGNAQRHDTELSLYYVLQGTTEVRLDEVGHVLGEDDCLTVAAGQRYAFARPSADLHMLEVSLPATFAFEVGN